MTIHSLQLRFDASDKGSHVEELCRVYEREILDLQLHNTSLKSKLEDLVSSMGGQRQEEALANLCMNISKNNSKNPSTKQSNSKTNKQEAILKARVEELFSQKENLVREISSYKEKLWNSQESCRDTKLLIDDLQKAHSNLKEENLFLRKEFEKGNSSLLIARNFLIRNFSFLTKCPDLEGIKPQMPDDLLFSFETRLERLRVVTDHCHHYLFLEFENDFQILLEQLGLHKVLESRILETLELVSDIFDKKFPKEDNEKRKFKERLSRIILSILQISKS